MPPLPMDAQIEAQERKKNLGYLMGGGSSVLITPPWTMEFLLLGNISDLSVWRTMDSA